MASPMQTAEKLPSFTEPFAVPEAAPRPLLLIVDDVDDNRAVLARRFQRRGFEIMEASSGRQALDLISRQRFDTVMLDVMMPEIDGFEVLRRIRTLHSASSLPVIMVTAKTQSEDVVAALQLGANDYVTKPVDFAVALARVNTQIERKRAEIEVERSNEQLRLMNEQLESRVSERTAKLAAANLALETEIAQRQQSEARNHYLAHHDALTGLGNRLQFREQMSRAMAARQPGGQSVAALFIDLDGFKGINDSLGHAVGDALLKLIAERLRHSVGEEGRLARLGGDEFAILLHCGGEPQKAFSLAGRILEALGAPCRLQGHDLLVGASIGVAFDDETCLEPEDLLKNADLAMYRAKLDGRGTWRAFDPEMDAAAQARRLLEIELRGALVSGALSMFYQPLVDLRTRRITGFEALMRWQHAERGFISPAAFIPVAEEIGVIVPMGEWALKQACAEAMKWPADIKVAVNLSSVQFARGNLVATVVQALAGAGLAPGRLELEITESVLLEKSESNLETLKQLRSLGVRIAMDDFGTGYSSLSYLRSFQFDKIKIDQSFIRDLATDAESQAIVHAITGLGSSFGITTTAEGVETQEQFDCLVDRGCGEVQGKLFSMPVPADQIAAMLRTLGHK